MNNDTVVIRRYCEAITCDLDKLQALIDSICVMITLGQRHELPSEINEASRLIIRLTRNLSELKTINENDPKPETSKFIQSSEIRLEKFQTQFQSSCQESSNFVSHHDIDESPIEETVSDTMLAQQLLHEKVQSHEEALELERSIINLNACFKDLAKIVHEQDQHFDTIEGNVDRAEKNVQQGSKSLKRALQLKAAAMPIAGAIAGTLIGGPVGLAIGSQIGMGVGLACGVAGGVAGGVFTKKQLSNHIGKEENKQLGDEGQGEKQGENQGEQQNESAIQASTTSSKLSNVFSKYKLLLKH